MKLFLLGIGVSLIYFHTLNSSLDQMTQRDCDFGIQAACEQLAKK